MKKLLNGKPNLRLLLTVFLSVALLLTAIFTLTSCLEVEEDTVDHIEISTESPKEIILGGFNIADYSINVVYKDGTVKNLPMTNEMITDAEILKTYHFGEQTLSFSYLDQTASFTLTIKRYEFDGITLPDLVVDYTGECFSLSVEGALPEGTTVSFPKGNSFAGAGTHPVTAVLVNDMYVTKEITGKLIINKIDFDLDDYDVIFDDASFVYDGTPKTLSITSNLPSFVEVTYSIGKVESNSMVEVGEYLVTCSFDAGVNYNHIENISATLTITKGKYDMSAVRFEGGSFQYDGAVHNIAIANPSALPKGVNVSYENNGQITAGTYTVIAHFTGDSNNYEPIRDMTATLYIAKANVTVKDVKLDAASFVYDRTPKTIFYTGTLPSGVSFEGYEYFLIEGEKQTQVSAMVEVGDYLVKARFVYKDKVNYNTIAPITAQVEITKADITGIIFSDASFEYDGLDHVISATNIPKGVTATYTNNKQSEIGEYQATVSFTLSAEVAKNYNNIEPMTANINITRAKFGSDFKDRSFSYDGLPHTMEVTKVNAQGETVVEELPAGVTVFYSYYDTNGKLTYFNGATAPTSVIVYANYMVDDAHSGYVRSHYELDFDTDLMVTINNVTYAVIAQKAATFTITKATYYPSFKNQLNTYTGSAITVTIDETGDKAHYPNLDFAGNTYSNNVQTDIGFYSGFVTIKLTETAKQYYYEEVAPVEFYYAIRNAKTAENPEGSKVVYSVTVDESLFTDVVYEEGKDFKIYPDTSSLPKGIICTVTYPDEMSKPGAYAVRISASFYDDGIDDIYHVSYGDVAEYYWAFPSKFKPGTDGGYHFILAYTIIKKPIAINYTAYDTAKLAYDGTNKTVIEKNLQDWITVYYYTTAINPDTQQEEEVEFWGATVPGTYHLRAHPVITDPVKAEYYTVSDSELDFVICKGNFTGYSVGGDVVNYDGKLHNIIIYGLPEGITYTTSLGGADEGVSEVGVYKDVIVYFQNNSEYYNDLLNLKVDLIIENNVVDLSAITVYSRSVGLKNVKQFSTLKELLAKYVDLEGATVTWTVDYYRSPSMMYESTDTVRHGTSENMDDFTFNEFTVDDQFVYVDFTINLGKGYIFNDINESKTFSGYFNLYVGESIQIDASELFSKFTNNASRSVSQGTTIRSNIADLLSENGQEHFTVTAWKVTYFNGNTPYDDSYTDCNREGDADALYFFTRNTWANRYALVEYTIEAEDGYCFYDGTRCYRTITNSAKCLVNQNVTKIDDSFLQEYLKTTTAVEVPRFTYFLTYFGEYIDTSLIEMIYTIKNNGVVQNLNAKGDYYFGTNIDAFNLDCTLALYPGCAFTDSKDNSIVISNKAYTVKPVNEANVKKTEYNALDGKVIKQYQTLFETVLRDANNNLILPENATFTYNIVYTERVNNNSHKPIIGSYFDGGMGIINPNLIGSGLPTFKVYADHGEMTKDYVFSKAASYTVTLTFTADTGYVLINDDPVEPAVVSTYNITFAVTANSVETLPLTDLLNYGVNSHEVDQYSQSTEFYNLVQNVYANTNNYAGLSIKWDVEYINPSAAYTAESFSACKKKNSTELYTFPISAYGNSYVLFTVYVNVDEGGDYIISPANRYSYIFSTRFTVNPKTAIIPSKLSHIKDKTFEYPQNTILQSIYYDFAIDASMMTSIRYSVMSSDYSISLAGDWSYVYTFSIVESYTVTIELQSINGHIFVNENGVGSETASVTFTLIIYQEDYTTLNFTDAEKNNLTYSKDIYINDDLYNLVNPLFKDSKDAITSVDYQVAITDKTFSYWQGGSDSGTLYSYEPSPSGGYSMSVGGYAFEIAGEYQATITITLLANKGTTHYVLKDKNGDTVATNGGTYTFKMKITVPEIVYVDMSDFLSFWGDVDKGMIVGKHLENYFFYHIDRKAVSWISYSYSYPTSEKTNYGFTGGYKPSVAHLGDGFESGKANGTFRLNYIRLTANNGYAFLNPDGTICNSINIANLEKKMFRPDNGFVSVSCTDMQEADGNTYSVSSGVTLWNILPSCEPSRFDYEFTVFYYYQNTSAGYYFPLDANNTDRGAFTNMNLANVVYFTVDLHISCENQRYTLVDRDGITTLRSLDVQFTFIVKPAVTDYSNYYSENYINDLLNKYRTTKTRSNFIEVEQGSLVADAMQIYNIKKGTLTVFLMRDSSYYVNFEEMVTYDIADGQLSLLDGMALSTFEELTTFYYYYAYGAAQYYYIVSLEIEEMMNGCKATNVPSGGGKTVYGAFYVKKASSSSSNTPVNIDLSYAQVGATSLMDDLATEPRSMAEYDEHITVNYAYPFLSNLIKPEGVEEIDATFIRIDYNDAQQKDVVTDTDPMYKEDSVEYRTKHADYDFSALGASSYTADGEHSKNCVLVVINKLSVNDGYVITDPYGNKVTELSHVYFYVFYDPQY